MDELIERELRALRELIGEKEARFDQAMLAEQARLRAEYEVMNDRLARMNQFREAMADQAARFATRDEMNIAKADGVTRYEAARAYTNEQLAGLEETRYADAAALDARLTRMADARQALETDLKDCIKRPEFEEVKRISQERGSNTRDYVDGQFAAKLAPIDDAISLLSRPNWSAMAVALSLTIGLVAGGWLVIGLKIDSTVTPLALAFEQSRAVTVANGERLRFQEGAVATVTQNSTISITDRAQLNERVRHLETVLPTGASAVADLNNLKTNVGDLAGRLAALRADQARQDAALIEIETQFCGQDNPRNQIHAQDLRWMAMLWEKSFGTVLPIVNSLMPASGAAPYRPAAATTDDAALARNVVPADRGRRDARRGAARRLAWRHRLCVDCLASSITEGRAIDYHNKYRYRRAFLGL